MAAQSRANARVGSPTPKPDSQTPKIRFQHPVCSGDSATETGSSPDPASLDEAECSSETRSNGPLDDEVGTEFVEDMTHASAELETALLAMLEELADWPGKLVPQDGGSALRRCRSDRGLQSGQERTSSGDMSSTSCSTTRFSTKDETPVVRRSSSRATPCSPWSALLEDDELEMRHCSRERAMRQGETPLMGRLKRAASLRSLSCAASEPQSRLSARSQSSAVTFHMPSEVPAPRSAAADAGCYLATAFACGMFGALVGALCARR